jgi:predicted nuclease with TOPRIM domain
MDELLIYYELEVETLRARVNQQNAEILGLTNQLSVRYKLYSDLENEFNRFKDEYEQFKLERIYKHSRDEIPEHSDPGNQPHLEL